MKNFCKLLILASIGYFLCVGAYKLTLLGVPVDTSAYIITARNILGCVIPGNFYVNWPLMETFYSGWALSYLLAFVMYFSGPAFFYYLFFAVVLTAIGLCAMTWVLSRWFNIYVACIVCLLIVVDINFVRSSRFAFEALEIIVFSFFWIALAFFVLGIERKRLCFFAAGAFVCGFGCWIKLSFFCYLLPASLLFIFTPARVRNTWFGNSLELKKVLPVSCFFFLFAFSPVIYVNIISSGLSINGFIGSIIEPSRLHNNLDVMRNLIGRLANFILMLNGGLALDGVRVPWNNFYPWLFVASALFLIVYMAVAVKPVFPRRMLAVISVFYALVLLILCYVPDMFRLDHIILLYPFPELVCAVAFYCALTCIRPVIIPSVLIAALMFVQLSVNAGRTIAFFENMNDFLVPGQNCIPDVFAVRRIMDKRLGYTYYPSRLGAYFLDIDSGAFSCDEADPINEAVSLFGYDMIDRKEWSLLVSRKEKEQIFKKRFLSLARSAGFIIKEELLIENKKPKSSYQFYTAYKPALGGGRARSD